MEKKDPIFNTYSIYLEKNREKKRTFAIIFRKISKLTPFKLGLHIQPHIPFYTIQRNSANSNDMLHQGGRKMLDTKGANFDSVLKRYDILLDNVSTPEEIAKKMLPTDPIYKKIAEDVVYMKYKDIAADVAEALEKGKDPHEIINEALVSGMEIVSDLYAQHVYYLPEIMLAAKTMEIGIGVAEKRIPGGRSSKGTIIMHAVEGDPHDIGKNIAAVMMRSAGYTVVDMGRDVPVDEVVAKTEEMKPFMVSGTALMTTTMPAIPRIASRLKEKGIEIPVIGAGGAVNRDYVESFDLGVYSEKAPQTPLLAQKAIEGYDWRKLREEWDQIVKGA